MIFPEFVHRYSDNTPRKTRAYMALRHMLMQDPKLVKALMREFLRDAKKGSKKR